MESDHCFEGGAVIARLESGDKFEAIRELIRRAPVFGEIENLSEFVDIVIAREKLQSTGFGHGVAVAHGRSPRVKNLAIALGVSPEGIPFDSPDGLPVHFLFVIASPLLASCDYLKALSSLVRAMRDRGVRESILASSDESEIEGFIRNAIMRAYGGDIRTQVPACGAAS